MEKDQTITTTKTTKQQTTNNINKQVPFTFFTHNGIRCMVHIPHSFEMYMQCRSKKNHQSINKIIYHTLHLHVPSPTRSPHLTSPYIQFLTLSIPSQQHLPIPSLTHSLALTISGLSPPTYLPTYPPILPYPGILGIQCPAFPFPLPALHYLHTYIHTFLSTSPAYL